MKIINSFGRFLDQPILISNLDKKVPLLLSGSGLAYGIHETIQSKEENRKKTALKSAIILTATIFSALKAPKVADFLIKRKSQTQKEFITGYQKVVNENAQNVKDIMLEDKNISQTAIDLLKKSQSGKILTLKEVSYLREALHKDSFNKLIPEPENTTSGEIFKEIGWLSIFGAVPVIGGILGGIIADKITEKNWKQGINNKITEGVYQYLANIFM